MSGLLGRVVRDFSISLLILRIIKEIMSKWNYDIRVKDWRIIF